MSADSDAKRGFLMDWYGEAGSLIEALADADFPALLVAKPEKLVALNPATDFVFQDRAG